MDHRGLKPARFRSPYAALKRRSSTGLRGGAAESRAASKLKAAHFQSGGACHLKGKAPHLAKDARYGAPVIYQDVVPTGATRVMGGA